MEYKRNEATLNRPEGDRVIDAPHLFIDLNDYTRQLQEEPAWEKNDRNSITIYKTERLSMVLVGLHAKAVMKHRPVDGISNIQLLEGKASIEVGNQKTDMKPGNIMTFHSCIDHTVEALDDTFLLLTVDKADHDG
jgi:quercetin dioxygenase-like cupin family protein